VPGTVTEDQLATPLRGHQAVAADNSVSAFLDHHARISVVMATGTGKTLVALHVAHRVAPNGNVVLFAPNIQLLHQTAQVWHREGRRGLYLTICHEDAGGVLPGGGVLRVGSAAELAHHAAGAAAFGPLNVFCTYCPGSVIMVGVECSELGCSDSWVGGEGVGWLVLAGESLVGLGDQFAWWLPSCTGRGYAAASSLSLSVSSRRG
jgi:hypothetical protein